MKVFTEKVAFEPRSGGGQGRAMLPSRVRVFWEEQLKKFKK